MPTPDSRELRSLVQTWWHHPAWEIRHLARNLVLDCCCLAEPDHPDLEACGNRLDAEAERLLEQLAPELGSTVAEAEVSFSGWTETWTDVRRRLHRMQTERIPQEAEGDPGTDPNLEVLRYVDGRTVYQRWLYPGSPRSRFAASRGESGAARIRSALEAVLRHPLVLRDWHSEAKPAAAEALTLTAPGQVVWVTETSPAPHRRPELADLDGSARAFATVRLMGLPGYDEGEDRRRRVALVAISYRVDPADLRIPSVLHALSSPHFFPGYKHEEKGRVASLDEDHRSPWQRDDANSTVPEWVHRNLSLLRTRPTLELVGFFDA